MFTVVYSLFCGPGLPKIGSQQEVTMRIWILLRLLPGLLFGFSVCGKIYAGQALLASAPPAVPVIQSQIALDLSLSIVQSGDNGHLPFAIVDKQAAVVMVYRRDGTLAGSSPVLLGLAAGDTVSNGVGQRTQLGQLRITDRTTPAGRFESVPGRNVSGEPVVWIDYGSALAIHRLRPGPSREKRALRMASANPRDKRISAGCVVVPEAFYDTVIQPVLGDGHAVVYITPDNGHWQKLPQFLTQRAF